MLSPCLNGCMIAADAIGRARVRGAARQKPALPGIAGILLREEPRRGEHATKIPRNHLWRDTPRVPGLHRLMLRLCGPENMEPNHSRRKTRGSDEMVCWQLANLANRGTGELLRGMQGSVRLKCDPYEKRRMVKNEFDATVADKTQGVGVYASSGPVQISDSGITTSLGGTLRRALR